ncbi:ribonuclease H [Sesbania bispinosa]|nr:ribonuclease H [Sesbania bispinosa]
MHEEILIAFSVMNTCKPDRWVSWIAPREGVVAINSDGSALGCPGRAGFGGLIRNHIGEWIMGYYGSNGSSNVLHA